MRVLELFAGARCMGKAAEELGHEVVSVDWTAYPGIDLVMDINDFKSDTVDFVPDHVHASFDCTTYTIAAISTHRNGTEPKSEYAKQCDKVNQHVISLIKHWRSINHSLTFSFENPRGMLRHMPFMKEFKRHTVWYCFAGDTKIITDEGIKSIGSLAGTIQNLLVSDGVWQKSPIRNYGIQEIVELTVSRAGKKKIIRTTGNHLWKKKCSKGFESTVKTLDLKKGHRLLSAFTSKNETLSIIDEWVARGFVFGDGSVRGRVGKQTAEAQFCGEKDEDLKCFFKIFGVPSKRKDQIGVSRLFNLPLEYKTKTARLTNTDSEIYSWISGYFAADGSVSKAGQCSLYSSVRANLELVRDLCIKIGIGTYAIKESRRLGYGKELSSIYAITFMASDLTSDFLIIKEHKKRFINNLTKHQPKRFHVVSVEKTGIYEDVFCAEVEGYNTFTLEDNILTHNCKYGDDRAKPTDIWTNIEGWQPKPMCGNYKYDKDGNVINQHCHHQSARRGAKTGTQGRKNAHLRSLIPYELCVEILSAIGKEPIIHQTSLF